MGHILGVFLGILLCSHATAANWVSTSGVTALKAGNAAPGYTTKAHCELIEGELCMEDKSDARKYLVVQFREGPFEGPSSITPCADQADCDSQIVDVVAKCGDSTYQAFTGDIDNDSTFTDGMSNLDDLESWCNRPTEIPKLVFDQATSDAVDTADGVILADRALRETKRQALIGDLKTCVALFKAGTPTNTELRTCLFKLMKSVVHLELQTGDL